MRSRLARSGWRAVALIAAVYIYFLIFAQFAFLARLGELGITGNALKWIMAAMAAAGIFFSLATPRVRFLPNPPHRLRAGLALSAIAALATLAPLSTPIAAIVAFMIGAALGITTVTLVTHLGAWTGESGDFLSVGLGTGIAYLVCNVPVVFTAAPTAQAILAAFLCLLVCAVPLGESRAVRRQAVPGQFRMPFAVALTSFAALIWLDSAAFYIIQHTQALKAATWLGSAHLWANGASHLSAAIAAAVLLQRGRTLATLALAFAGLAVACVLLQNPALVGTASLFYPIGVSLYSVALVAYPSFLTEAHSISHRGRQAGWIYAIAGWLGSALGIGMGQNLGRVPVGFVALAAVVVLAPVLVLLFRNRSRELTVVAGAALVAGLAYGFLPVQGASASLNAVERGRQVYISEGCISCHSQYVRPNSPDVGMWGPVQSLQSIHAQQPPLIGNRRQGPDLAEVGLRRSPLWLKAHLVNPAEVSYRSFMPSYAFLFRDRRGDDLVDYLESLRGPGAQQQLQRELASEPSAQSWHDASAAKGASLFHEHCATCHDAQGPTRVRWIGAWRKLPPDAAALHEFAQNQTDGKLAQIAKFGIPGTDMPGHEYLSDAELASLALYLKSSSRDIPHSSTR